MTDEFEKLAQERKYIKNKFRIPSIIGRQVAKLNPAYKANYELLVKADDYIRSNFGDVPVKNLIGELKKAHKSHRWLGVIDMAARINNIAKMMYSNEVVKELLESRNKAVKDFYFKPEGDFDDEHVQKAITASHEDDFLKQAFIGDLARRMTDKFFSPFQDEGIKKLKMAINMIANKAETLGKRIIQIYEMLDVARAKGSISDYVNGINLIKKDQKAFETLFIQNYNAIKEYLPQRDAETPEKAEKAEKATEKPLNPKDVKPSTEPLKEMTVTKTHEDVPAQESVPEPVPEKPVEKTVNLQPLQDVTVQTKEQPKEQAKEKYNFPSPPVRPGELNIETEGVKPVYPFGNPVKSAKEAMARGEVGLAAAIMAKYSQDLEDHGFIRQSVEALLIAEDLLNAK